ncbi:MAG: hypothetical protein IPK12_15035 [Gemmatimonadetes bacterium]|nr:hypothetical protein [Gemmatimonadota bacterium]
MSAAFGTRSTLASTSPRHPCLPASRWCRTPLIFTATSGGNDPNSQVVNITNTGGGTLSALSRTITYQAGGSGLAHRDTRSTTGPTTLTFAPQTGQLAAGTYRATVVVTDPASANSDSVRVRFTLSAPPRIGVSPATVAFAAASGGANPGAAAVSVTNTGGGSVTGLQLGTIAYGAGQPTNWLTATLNGTTAPATITLRATVGALTAGLYTASVPVSSALGIPSQVVNVNFTLSGGQGAIVGLLGLNQNGFTDSVLPQQVVVRVLDANSNPVVGATVGWTPGQGGSIVNATTVTDNNGEAKTSWRLGPAAGPQTLTATSGGLTPYVVNAVGSSANGGNYPGEPPGFTVISNRRFDAKVEDGWLDRGDANFSIATDASAPISAPNVGQSLFPQGFTGGRGPINTYRVIGQYNRKQMYLSFWFKLSPTGTEGLRTG